MAYDFSKLDAAIKETDEWLAREYTGVRTGRATPSILDVIKPEAYGTRSPVSQLANISVEDARSLRVIPWDKTLTKAIEKAIMDADLGVGVSTDETGLRVTFPELTGERRVMLTKLSREKLETAKVTLRGHRTDALKDLDAAEKEGGMGADELKRLKEEVQKKIDKGVEGLEAQAKRKEAEIAA
jgi:ribosome recycling factor